MKKLLLSVFALAGLCTMANAETTTLNVSDATDIVGTHVEAADNAAEHYQPLESLKIGDYSFTFGQNKEGAENQAPAYFYPTATAKDKSKTIRVYKGTECYMTITAPAGKTFKSLTLTGSNGTANAAVTADAGTATMTKATEVTWTNATAVSSVKLTFTGSNYRIKTIDVSTDGGSVNPPATDELVLLEATNSLGSENWTLGVQNVSGSDYGWTWKSYNSQYYLNASANVGGQSKGAINVWAVSPVVTLAADANTLKFEHAAKFQTNLTTDCTVNIREAGTTTWTKLEIPTWPEAGNWTFAESGDINIAAWNGKKVEIGFNYISTETQADTWEIRNLTTKGTVEGGTPNPPQPEGAKFEKTTSLSDGSFVFAIDSKVGAPVAETAAYGRMTLTDATFNGNIVTTPETNAYTIAIVDGKATIKDTYGRFYGMDATHLTSFQLYTELNDGCYWTYTLEGDAFKFVNALNTTCFICQSKGTQGTWYTNIAPANAPEEGSFNLPSLYKMVGSAIDNVASEIENAPVVYYNLQGQRVANPENGVYIRVQGTKAVKVAL